MVPSREAEMIYSVVLARSGSKRLPGKNIRPFMTVPMLAHTILKMRSWSYFDAVFLSTDSEAYAKIGLEAGALVPCLREKELGNDDVTTIDVIKAFIAREGASFRYDDLIVAVYPCTPLLQREDLLRGEELVNAHPDCIVYPCIEYGHPPQRSFRLDKESKPIFCNQEFTSTRTQDLDKYYHDAGQFYIGSKKKWLEAKDMHVEARVIPYPVGSFVDIDTDEDWCLAEMIYASKL